MPPPNEYITVATVIDKIGAQLYKILGVAPGADISTNENVLSALRAANARIDSSLRYRYTLPIDPTPPELEQPGADMFRYFLLGIKQYAVSEDDRLRYTDAEKYLAALKRGEERLDLPGEEEIPPSQVTAVYGRISGACGPRAVGAESACPGDCYTDILGPARRCP